MDTLRIAVLYNLPSHNLPGEAYRASEEDTGASAAIVGDALSRLDNVDVRLVAIDETHMEAIGSVAADCVVNLIEWTGLDLPYAAAAFRALRATGIPYTGSNARVFVGTTDKLRMKRLFDRFGVPTPAWAVMGPGRQQPRQLPGYPAIVKLAYEHCGIGLTAASVVSDEASLLRTARDRIGQFRQPVLVERYIDGREYQVTVIDDGRSARVLPVSEYVFDTRKPATILTYDSRWNRQRQQDVGFTVRLARMPAPDEARIARVCLDAYRAIGFWGYARFDIRVTPEGGIYVLETNANPGIDDDMDNGLVRSFAAAGMDLTSFMAGVIDAAAVRFRRSGLSAGIRSRCDAYTAAVPHRSGRRRT